MTSQEAEQLNKNFQLLQMRLDNLYEIQKLHTECIVDIKEMIKVELDIFNSRLLRIEDRK